MSKQDIAKLSLGKRLAEEEIIQAEKWLDDEHKRVDMELARLTTSLFSGEDSIKLSDSLSKPVDVYTDSNDEIQDVKSVLRSKQISSSEFKTSGNPFDTITKMEIRLRKLISNGEWIGVEKHDLYNELGVPLYYDENRNSRSQRNHANNNVISYKHFENTLLNLNVPIKKSEIVALQKRYDFHNNGEVDTKEFLLFFEPWAVTRSSNLWDGNRVIGNHNEDLHRKRKYDYVKNKRHVDDDSTADESNVNPRMTSYEGNVDNISSSDTPRSSKPHHTSSSDLVIESTSDIARVNADRKQRKSIKLIVSRLSNLHSSQQWSGIGDLSDDMIGNFIRSYISEHKQHHIQEMDFENLILKDIKIPLHSNEMKFVISEFDPWLSGTIEIRKIIQFIRLIRDQTKYNEEIYNVEPGDSTTSTENVKITKTKMKSKDDKDTVNDDKDTVNDDNEAISGNISGSNDYPMMNTLSVTLDSIRQRLEEQYVSGSWIGCTANDLKLAFQHYLKRNIDFIEESDFKGILTNVLNIPLLEKELKYIIFTMSVHGDTHLIHINQFLKFMKSIGYPSNIPKATSHNTIDYTVTTTTSNATNADAVTNQSKQSKLMVELESNINDIGKRLKRSYDTTAWTGIDYVHMHYNCSLDDATDKKVISQSRFIKYLKDNVRIPLHDQYLNIISKYFSTIHGDVNSDIKYLDFLNWCKNLQIIYYTDKGHRVIHNSDRGAKGKYDNNNDSNHSTDATVAPLIANEMELLRSENAALLRELSLYGPEFFDEVEDLKFYCSEVESSNKSLTLKLLELCDYTGIDPRILDVQINSNNNDINNNNNIEMPNLNMNLSSSMHLNQTSQSHLSSENGDGYNSVKVDYGLLTNGRVSSTSVTLSAGDIMKHCFVGMGYNKCINIYLHLESTFCNCESEHNGIIAIRDFENILNESNLKLTIADINTISQAVAVSKLVNFDTGIADNNSNDRDAMVMYKQFLSAIKPLIDALPREEMEVVTNKNAGSNNTKNDKFNDNSFLVFLCNKLVDMIAENSWNGLQSLKNLKQSFRMSDYDNLRVIHSGEFRSIIRDFQIPLTSKEIKKLINNLHSEGSDEDTVNYESFIAMASHWEGNTAVTTSRSSVGSSKRNTHRSERSNTNNSSAIRGISEKLDLKFHKKSWAGITKKYLSSALKSHALSRSSDIRSIELSPYEAKVVLETLKIPMTSQDKRDVIQHLLNISGASTTRIINSKLIIDFLKPWTRK